MPLLEDYEQSTVNPMGDLLTGDSADKITTLQTKKQEKLERLGTKNQFADLERGTYTVLPDGRVEGNSNKIWNNLTDQERQFLFGWSAGEYYNPNLDPQEMRRLYGFGTKDGNFKSGVSTGGSPVADVRYNNTIDPRYDDPWRKSGPRGPDLSKKRYDLPMDFAASTVMEGIDHGNEGLLKRRLYKDVFSKEALEAGGGASEYYKNGVGEYFGDATDYNVTPEREEELKNWFRGLVDKHSAEGQQRARMEEFRQAQFNPYDRLGNTVSALASTFTKPFVGLADTIVEQFGGDLGTDEEITEKVNDLFGYDPKFMEDTGRLVSQDIERMNKEGWTAEGVFTTVSRAATTPELFGELLGFMGSMATGFGGALGKASTAYKSGKKALAVAEKAGDTAKIAQATKQIDNAKKILDDANALKKGLSFAGKNLGFTANTVSTSSGDIEEYAKNAGISVDEVPLDKKLAIGGMNALLNKVDFIVDKGLIFNPTMKEAIINLSRGATKRQLKELGKGLAKVGFIGTVGAGAEGGTEYLQEFMTQINQQVGEDTGKTIFDAWNDEKNKLSRATSGIMGIAGAQQMNLASTVASSPTVVTDVADKIKETVTPKPTEQELKAEEMVEEELGNREALIKEFDSSIESNNVEKAIQDYDKIVAYADETSDSKLLEEADRKLESVYASFVDTSKKVTEGDTEQLRVLGANKSDKEKIELVMRVVEASEKEDVSEDVVSKMASTLQLDVKEVKNKVNDAVESNKLAKTMKDVEKEVTGGSRGYNTYIRQFKDAVRNGDDKLKDRAATKLMNFSSSMKEKKAMYEQAIEDAKRTIASQLEEIDGVDEKDKLRKLIQQKMGITKVEGQNFDVNHKNVAKNMLDGSIVGPFKFIDNIDKAVNDMEAFLNSRGVSTEDLGVSEATTEKDKRDSTKKNLFERGTTEEEVVEVDDKGTEFSTEEEVVTETPTKVAVLSNEDKKVVSKWFNDALLENNGNGDVARASTKSKIAEAYDKSEPELADAMREFADSDDVFDVEVEAESGSNGDTKPSTTLNMSTDKTVDNKVTLNTTSTQNTPSSTKSETIQKLEPTAEQSEVEAKLDEIKDKIEEQREVVNGLKAKSKTLKDKIGTFRKRLKLFSDMWEETSKKIKEGKDTIKKTTDVSLIDKINSMIDGLVVYIKKIEDFQKTFRDNLIQAKKESEVVETKLKEEKEKLKNLNKELINETINITEKGKELLEPSSNLGLDLSKLNNKQAKAVSFIAGEIKKHLEADIKNLPFDSLDYDTKTGKYGKDSEVFGRLFFTEEMVETETRTGKVNKRKFKLDDRVASIMAIEVLKYSQTGLSNLTYNDDTQLKKMLGLANTTGLPYTSENLKLLKRNGRYHGVEATSLGADIRRSLGIKQKGSVDARTEGKLEGALGTLAFRSMEKMGWLQYDNKSFTTNDYKNTIKDIEEFNDGRDLLEGDEGQTDVIDTSKDIPIPMVKANKAVVEKLKFYKDMYNELSDTFAEEFAGKAPRKFERKPRTHVVRGMEKETKVPSKQQKVLNESEKTEWKLDLDNIELLRDAYLKDEKRVLKLFGWKSPDSVHSDFAGNVESKNDAIKKGFEDLFEFTDSNKDESFFFDWFFSKSGRFFIDSSTINPQTNKLHRFLMSVKGSESVIDDEVGRTEFKLAVVQAFDGSNIVSKRKEDQSEIVVNGEVVNDLGAIDKQSVEESVKQFEAIRQIVDNYDGDVLDLVEGTDHPAHALMAIKELKNYKDSGKFKTKMVLETDAVTSGFILNLLISPVMEINKLAKWLAKGGFWLGGTGYKSFGEYNGSLDENNNKLNPDSYQTGATAVSKLVRDRTKNDKDRATVELVGDVNRNFMKSPFMTFIYGASTGSIKKSMGRHFADEVINKLSDPETVLETAESLKRLGVKIDIKKGTDPRVIAKSIRNASMFKNELGLRDIHNLVSKSVIKLHGKAVEDYLNSEFAEIVGNRELKIMGSKTAINNAFSELFNEFKAEYDKRMRGVTSKEESDKVLEEMAKEGKIPGIFTYDSSDDLQERTPIVKRGKVPKNDPVQTLFTSGGRTVHPRIRELIEAPTSGAVLNIHWFDGGLISELLLGDKDALGIHDASLQVVGKATKNSMNYTKAAWERSQNYSIIDNIIDEMDRFNIKGDTYNELKSLSSTIKKNKNKLSNMRVDAEHMSMPGSKVTFNENGETPTFDFTEKVEDNELEIAVESTVQEAVTIEDDYSSYSKTLIDFIQSKKPVKVDMNLGLAVRVVKGESKEFGSADGNIIKLPDFEGLLNNKNALKAVMKDTGKTEKEVKDIVTKYSTDFYLDMTNTHEHIHVASVAFMEQNPNDEKTKYVNATFKKLLKMAEKDEYLNNIQNGHWKLNVKEFLAVSLSNPEMIKYLDNIKSQRQTMLHKLVDKLAKMVGIRGDSVAGMLVDSLLKMAEGETNESSTVSPQQVPTKGKNDIINDIKGGLDLDAYGAIPPEFC